MGAFTVEQRTKDAMFNATALLKQWNETMGERKEITKFFDNENTKVFISALMEEEKLHTQNSAYVKSKASKGENAGTWMHPILFVKFAMWLNPRFEVQVIKFVYDQMLAFRNEAGDAYKAMCSAVTKIVSRNYARTACARTAIAINYVVFNAHKPMLRNDHGDEVKMRDLFHYERKVSDLINDGFITSYDTLMDYLRMKWKERWTPKILRPSDDDKK